MANKKADQSADSFDVVVIGAGPGGYTAAVRAAQLGFKTACVEKDPTLGGTCLNVGCIPSKALLQSTKFYEWTAKKSKDFGVITTGVVADFRVMMNRKEEIVKGLVNGIGSLFKNFKVEKIQGSARFISPQEIEVAGRHIKAKWFIIATGSEPIALPFLPFDEKRVVSSTGALSLPVVPEKMVVIGGGVIGVELASVYCRLGAKVDVIEMLPQIVTGLDPLISRQLLLLLQKQGMTFHLDAKVTGAKVQDNGVAIDLVKDGVATQLEGDVVLVAVGRRPYTRGLDLDKAGITLSPKGFIPVDGNMRTVVPNILAIGDVIEGPMLAHRASHEGVALVEGLAGLPVTLNMIGIPNVVYTHPEAASVGLTEEEAARAKIPVVIGTSYFKGNARARCSGDTDGFVKIIADKRSGRLIGMHILGSDASEMIAEGVIALEKNSTVADIAHAYHAHPTLSEVVMEAAMQCL
jgi:dihydrolipoamide dehydrogenase